MKAKSLVLVVILISTATLTSGGNSAHAALVSIRANVDPQAVLVCDGKDDDDKECTVTVTVADNGMKRCDLTIDYPVVAITAGKKDSKKSLTVVWLLKLAGGSTGTYKFDANNGVDIYRDTGNHFGDGKPDGDDKYKIPRDKSKKSEKAFNYTVTALRKVGDVFSVCGVNDPIIVNRD